MTRQLDTRDTAILRALGALGHGWHDRAALADALNRSVLNPEDLLALDVMVREGRIEIGKQNGAGRGNSRLVYRLRPTEPPAVGGWFWNEQTQKQNFQMPPHPDVDDCVLLPNGKYAYRSYAERDALIGSESSKVTNREATQSDQKDGGQ